MNHYDRRVAAGVRWLDATHPNWRETIARSKPIRMHDGARCVLATVMGYEYCEAYVDAGFTHTGAADHGFTIDSEARPDDNFADLQDAWDRVLADPVEDPDPVTYALTSGQLVELVTRAMNSAPTRGDYSELGLTVTYLRENNLL